MGLLITRYALAGIFPALLVWLAGGCRTAEVIPTIRETDPLVAPQASLVSVQAMDGTSAEVVVKSIRLDASDWQFTARANGGMVTQTAGSLSTLPDFALTTFRLTGLTAGQTYQLRLAFRFAGADSITALRTYVHQPGIAPRWTRLAHASFSGGDYSSFPVAVDGICGPNFERLGCGNPTTGAYVGNRVQLLRYPGPNQREMQTLVYDRATDSWPFLPLRYPDLPPRHQVFQYNLFFFGVDRHQFTGLGFIAEERAPDKYFYFRTMFAIFPIGGSGLVPPYGGEAGELAFFTTTDEAYFLTQNGSPTLRSISATLEQVVRTPLPEPPGTLATFTSRNIGYVVNQRPGQPTRLWAYDPTTDSWSQKADFPGPARSRGVAFSMARSGYFGLGLAPDGQGLRDVWQYNPTTNQWRYSSEYPGQGNQLLAVFSAPDGIKPERAYLGWGYEAQRTSMGVIRTVGCTDFWELTP